MDHIRKNWWPEVDGERERIVNLVNEKFKEKTVELFVIEITNLRGQKSYFHAKNLRVHLIAEATKYEIKDANKIIDDIIETRAKVSTKLIPV